MYSVLLQAALVFQAAAGVIWGESPSAMFEGGGPEQVAGEFADAAARFVW